jgi:starvation-inducible outer membrane lipoprotein
VIKQVAATGILVLLIAFLLAACASITEEPSSSESGAAVPGEKMSDDQRYAPGPMGSSNVRF